LIRSYTVFLTDPWTAGADPAVVGGWIAETLAERQAAEQWRITSRSARLAVTEEQIAAIVEEFGDMTAVLREAAPEDKLEVYQRLGLRLIYTPDTRTVTAIVDLGGHRGGSVCVRGSTRTDTPPGIRLAGTLTVT